MLRRQDVDLRVDVLLAVELHLQFAGTDPLDEFSDAGLDGERVVRLHEFLAQHAAKSCLDLGDGRRAFARTISGNLDQAVNDLLVLQADEDSDLLDRFERG